MRINQFFRLFKGIDFIRLFFLLGITAVIGTMLYHLSGKSEYVKIWVVVHSLLFLSVHMIRKDKKFMSMITSWAFLIYFTEYILLSIPVISAFIIQENWNGLFVIPSLFLVAISDLLYTSTFTFKNSRFAYFFGFNKNMSRINTRNAMLFEWNSGMRSASIFFYGFIYLIVLGFSFKGYVAHIGIILISMLISAFYFYGEPRLLIECYENSAKKFLVRKIALNLKYVSIVILPIIVISLVFEAELWYLLIIALLISYLIQILAILIKYSLFRENDNLERNSLIHIIASIGLLLPFIWPISITIGIRSYRKAIRNLTPYFDDYDQ